MTCLLVTTWDSLRGSLDQAQMSPDGSHEAMSVDGCLLAGHPSPGSEITGPTKGPSKKRASRAGQRNVNALSAAQLERKRANDREAQRAIRQRTKEQIDHLQKNNSELVALQEANQKLIAQLEQENAYLRYQHSGSGLPLATLDMTTGDRIDHGKPQTQRIPTSICIDDRPHTMAPDVSGTASETLGTRQIAWPRQSSPVSLKSVPAPTGERCGEYRRDSILTPWKLDAALPDPAAAATPSTAIEASSSATWSGAVPQNNYAMVLSTDTAPASGYEHSQTQPSQLQPQHQHTQPTVTGCGISAAAQYSPDRSLQHVPHAEFQNLRAAGPGGVSHVLAHAAQFEMAPIPEQVLSPGYSSYSARSSESSVPSSSYSSSSAPRPYLSLQPPTSATYEHDRSYAYYPLRYSSG